MRTGDISQRELGRWWGSVNGRTRLSVLRRKVNCYDHKTSCNIYIKFDAVLCTLEGVDFMQGTTAPPCNKYRFDWGSTRVDYNRAYVKNFPRLHKRWSSRGFGDVRSPQWGPGAGSTMGLWGRSWEERYYKLAFFNNFEFIQLDSWLISALCMFHLFSNSKFWDTVYMAVLSLTCLLVALFFKHKQVILKTHELHLSTYNLGCCCSMNTDKFSRIDMHTVSF